MVCVYVCVCVCLCACVSVRVCVCACVCVSFAKGCKRHQAIYRRRVTRMNEWVSFDTSRGLQEHTKRARHKAICREPPHRCHCLRGQRVARFLRNKSPILEGLYCSFAIETKQFVGRLLDVAPRQLPGKGVGALSWWLPCVQSACGLLSRCLPCALW